MMMNYNKTMVLLNKTSTPEHLTKTLNVTEDGN